MIYKVEQVANHYDCSVDGYYQRFVVWSGEAWVSCADYEVIPKVEFRQLWVSVQKKFIEADNPHDAIMGFMDYLHGPNHGNTLEFGNPRSGQYTIKVGTNV